MEDTVEIVDDSITCILPHEVLSQIFALLPLADRKSVRLTCRSWYDCCTCTNITKREKFVFRADASVEDAAEVMLRSSYSMMNLEFQGLPISDVPTSIWKECGLRIRRLTLHKCQWDDETICKIILHCENLTSFVITEGPLNGRCPLPYSTRLLNDLITKGIRRPNLLTLSIFTQSHEQESILRQIFLLYPRIKDFSFRLISHENIHLSSLLDFKNQHIFVRLDQCLNSGTRLESLTYDILTDGKWMETLDKAEQGLRLKHLETKLMYKKSMKDTIFNFFKSQRNLEVIRLSLNEANSQQVKNCFYHILESCPNLREFWLKTNPFHLKDAEVPRFVTSISKLNFLSLRSTISSSAHLPWFSILITNPVQLNLTTLKLKDNFNVDPAFYHALFQRCSSLLHLQLGYCFDEKLQAVFQYLLGLQTLVLSYTADCTDFGFTGRNVDEKQDGYSIKRLQQLTCLESLTHKVQVTEKSVLELQLPRLKFLTLRVEWYKQLSEEALTEFASHLPELQVLSVQSSYENIYLGKTIEFCKRLDNLNRLIFLKYLHPGLDNIGEEEELIESIFSVCHRLRYISWTNSKMYIRDPSTGKALCKDGYVFKFPRNIFKDESV